MKPIRALAVLTAALSLALVGCSSEATPKSAQDVAEPEEVVSETVAPPEPVDLSGEWEQSNKKSEENYQAATVTGDVIEIYWISDGGDTKSLYWAGTVEVPSDGTDTFSFDSVNDKSKTDNALLASGDDTKTFEFADGELSYEVSALGTTTTVRLAQK